MAPRRWQASRAANPAVGSNATPQPVATSAPKMFASNGGGGAGACVAYHGEIDGSLQGRRLSAGGIALIADIQFADASTRKDNKLDDKPGRMYSQTLGTFCRSMQAARSLGASSLILLGDQVDDRDREGDLAAAKVLESADAHFSGGAVGYLLGNHDTKWTQIFRDARVRSPVSELPQCFAWECEVESEDGGLPWVIVALDCYATSFAEAPGWGVQLPMNGEIGTVQLAWLACRLRAARDAGKHVVVLSHVPLNPNNSLDPTAVGYCGHRAQTRQTQAVADHAAVQRVLEQAGNVKLCLAGHDHPGALWADEQTGILYWTERACLFTEGPPELTGVVLRLRQHEAVLHVLANDSVHRIPYPSTAGPPPRNLAPPSFKPLTRNELAPLAAARLSIIFDMETGDPDDVLTLLFLAAHAAVDLKAVTITRPGSRDQVSLVRWLLQVVGLSDVRVGAQDWPRNINGPPLKEHFYRNFGRIPIEEHDCESAAQVLFECCDERTTLVTGGPVSNLAAALERDGFRLGRWVAQGGFAGQGVVPPHKQMDKFKGRTHNDTFNFGADPRAAKRALGSDAIGRRVCVSKNVCHRTLYDGSEGGWHKNVAEVLQATRACGGRPTRLKALELMHNAMSQYLTHKPSGKMLHDPLALAVALDESVCTLEEVEFSTQGDRWGCWLLHGSGTWVAVDYEEAAFRKVLLHDGFKAHDQAGSTSHHLALDKAKIATVEQAASELSLMEKQFRKTARVIREIVKIEERKTAGQPVNANQLNKISKKDEAVSELSRLEQHLEPHSGVREMYKDVIALLP